MPRRNRVRAPGPPSQHDASPSPVPEYGATRGRPKDATRREGVLQTTRELLVARGYDEITLSEVARLAGVSRPFMYDNWGTKFALVEDAIFSARDHTQLIDEDKPFAEALTELIAAMVAIQSDPAYLAGLPGLSAELYNRSDLVEQIENKYIAPVRAVYVELIERGKSAGTVRADVDGSALLDTIRGAVMLHTLIKPSLDQSALIEHLRSVVLNGISCR